MFQLEKMPLIWFLLNILKPNFATCDWFWADESQIGNLIVIDLFFHSLKVTLEWSLASDFHHFWVVSRPYISFFSLFLPAPGGKILFDGLVESKGLQLCKY